MKFRMKAVWDDIVFTGIHIFFNLYTFRGPRFIL